MENKSTELDYIKEYRDHNVSLESSSEYKKILPDVMKEVYTRYAESHISYLERELKLKGDTRSLYYTNEYEKLARAKELIKENPEEAAKLFFMLGSCHQLWGLQKKILREKYGLVWYAPSEEYPHILFD